MFWASTIWKWTLVLQPSHSNNLRTYAPKLQLVSPDWAEATEHWHVWETQLVSTFPKHNHWMLLYFPDYLPISMNDRLHHNFSHPPCPDSFKDFGRRGGDSVFFHFPNLKLNHLLLVHRQIWSFTSPALFSALQKSFEASSLLPSAM